MADAQVVHVDFVPLPNTGVISGTIQPVGTTITLRRITADGPIIATTTTDENGNYSFSDLPPDVYCVVPSYDGVRFNPSHRSVRIK